MLKPVALFITRLSQNLLVKGIASLFILLFCSHVTHAQVYKLSGTVIDSRNKTPLIGAAMEAKSTTDSTKRADAISELDGTFEITLPSAGTYRLRIFSLGYNRYEQLVTVTQLITDLGTINMKSDAVNLKTVDIKETATRAEQKGDTTQFHADAFKTNTDANAQDLITKMPGVTVDNTGAVKAHGENVQKVLVDGKPYFGDDATIALKNMPADVVDKVQIFDQMSDMSRFTGFDDGNSVKTINFITKAGMNKTDFGKIYAGYGTDDRYTAGFSLNDFHGARRISFLGLFNNINQQNFSAQDLLGVIGNSGGGRRGGGPGGGGNSSFFVGQQSGVTTTNSAGFNYTDMWGKKVTVTGSYFFNGADAVNSSTIDRSYFSKYYYTENDETHTTNYNHRANMRLEYTINANNSFLLQPAFTSQKNQNTTSYPGTYMDSTGALQSHTQNIYSANSHGYTFSNTALFRHKFAKAGRTISLNVDNSFNDKTIMASQNDTTINYYTTGSKKTVINQQVPNTSNGYSVKPTLTYTEPITKRSMAFASYAVSYNQSTSDKKTYNYNDTIHDYTRLDPGLSNNYKNTYTADIGGLGYRLRSKDNKMNFMVSANYQHAILQADELLPYTVSVTKTFDNILPSSIFMYKFNEGSNLRIFYRTSTSSPSISQLQNVIDNSNPLQLSAGNPDLKQSYTQTLFSRYGFTNSGKARSLFLFIFGSYTQDYIGNSTFIAGKDSLLPGHILMRKGSQLVTPVNINGNVTLRSNITYSLPIKVLKSNLNLNNGFTFSRTPGLLNDVLNITNTYNFSQGVTLSSNISKEVDFTLSYTGSYNIVNTTLQTAQNNNYFNHLAVAKLNWIIWKGFFINTEADQSLYSTQGSSSYNQNFILWNAAIGKRFLKKQNADVRLSAFDILNQNAGITRNVTDSYVEDVRSRVLHRYFLLTFTYNLKGAPPAMPQRPDMPHTH